MRLKPRTKVLWNGVWLITAILFLALYFAATSQRKELNKFGNYLIAQYLHHYQLEYNLAAQSLKEGKPQLAIDTLKQWHEIKKGDRIFINKRKLLLTLCEVLRRQDDIPKMLHWAKLWHDLDPRDITGSAYYYEAQRLSPLHHQEGLDSLEQLFKLFPANQQLARFKAMNRDTTSSQSAKWEIFWDTGSGFTASQAKIMSLGLPDTHGFHIISLQLPSNINQFRLDLPEGSKLRISNFSLSVNGKNHLLDKAQYQLLMMRESQGSFISEGKIDPRIIFNKFPNIEGSSDTDLNITFKFRVVPIQNEPPQP